MSRQGMMTTREVAESLGTSADRVRALIAGGRLAAIDLNVGGSRPNYRVGESDLARFKESGRVAVVPASAAKLPRRDIPNLIGL